jgi:uncharacterized hydrophobic protein (TIGR00271 family)
MEVLCNMSPWFAPTPERIRAVTQEIADGSEPKISYYLLLVTAAMIACFGLVTNSTAVIIGAMLVSPLMTPIFGIAQAMLRGDGSLLFHGLRAEFGGVALAVGAAFLFGLSPVAGVATPEMLSRTHPQLLDLMVAVFAGFAGAYALLDERVSPALPGVAIATAIVPPLSTCGLCLAMGAYGGAFGAFILFFANFIAILLVSLIMFSLAGMAPEPRWNSVRDVSRRFGTVIVGFTVIAVILTHSLVRITTERNLQNNIGRVLSRELAKETIAIDDYQFKQHDDSVFVLATVRSPQIIRPSRVTELQATLEKELERPTELVVRTMVAEDVAAVGSDVKVGPIDLNGVFFSTELSLREQKKRLARQVLLEELDSGGGFRLINLEYGENPGGTLVYATIKAIRPPLAQEVAAVEKLLQERLDDPKASLVLQCSSATILSSDGPLLIEWTQYGKILDEQPEDLADIRRVIEAEVKKIPDVFPVAVHFNIEEDSWQALAEVVGPRPVSPTELSLVQEAVSESISHPVELSIWHRTDVVVTAEGYKSYKDFTRHTLEERIEELPEIFEDMAAR